jgi:tetratricopeptide (TPR) repeat protein
MINHTADCTRRCDRPFLFWFAMQSDAGHSFPHHSKPPGDGLLYRANRLLGALLWLLVAAFVAGLGWFELSGVDLGYHIAYGRWMIEHGRVLDVDPFLYAVRDHHFVNANWLAQVIVAWVESRFGVDGLTALRTLLIGGAFVGAAVLLRRFNVRAGGIALTWLIMALGAYERFTLRPELFSYLLAVLMLLILLRRHNAGCRRSLARDAVSLGAVQILWVNLHSYFLVGPILTGGALVGAVLARRWAGTNDSASSASDRRAVAAGRAVSPQSSQLASAARPVGHWAVLLLIQIACCLVNPWGWRGAAFPLRTLRYLSAEGVMARSPDDPVLTPWGVISEFQSPFGFFAFVGAWRTTYAYAGMLVVAAIAVVWAIRCRRWRELLMLLALVAMSTQMRRNVALLAVVGIPIAAILLAARPRRLSPGRSSVWWRWTATVALAAAGVWTVMALRGIRSGEFYFAERRPTRRLAAGWSPRVFPHAAIEWINAAPDLEPKLFTDLMAGSNVLPWLRPGWRVFITTNTFAYPERMLMRAWNVGLDPLREDYRRLFDEFDVRVVLLRAHDPTQRLIQALMRDGDWALTWFDPDFVIFIRRTPGHANVIAANERRADQLDAAAWAADTRPHESTGFRMGMMAAVPLALGWDVPAKSLLERAVEAEPTYFEAWRNLGVIHARALQSALAAGRLRQAEQSFDAAMPCLERSIQSGSDDVPGIWRIQAGCHSDYGRVFLAANDPRGAAMQFQAALDEYQRVADRDPDSSGAWINLASAHGNLLKAALTAGNAADADLALRDVHRCADRAIRLEARAEPAARRIVGLAWLDQGAAYLARNESRRAIEALRSAVRELDAASPPVGAVPDETVGMLAGCLLELGRTRLALNDGAAAIESLTAARSRLVQLADAGSHSGGSDATDWRLWLTECDLLTAKAAVAEGRTDLAAQTVTAARARISDMLTLAGFQRNPNAWRMAAEAHRMAAGFLTRDRKLAESAAALRAAAECDAEATRLEQSIGTDT